MSLKTQFFLLTLFTTLYNLLPLGFSDFAVTRLANSSFEKNHFSRTLFSVVQNLISTMQRHDVFILFLLNCKSLLHNNFTLFGFVTMMMIIFISIDSSLLLSLQNNYNHHFCHCLQFPFCVNLPQKITLFAPK